MGYRPPPAWPRPLPPPTGIITLPPDTRPDQAEAFRRQIEMSYTNMLVVSHGVQVTLPPHSPPRMWADRHLEALSNGLVAAAITLVVAVVWVVST